MLPPMMMDSYDSWNVPKPKERKLFFGKQVDQDSIEYITQQILFINENDRYLEKLYALHDLKYKAKPIEIFIDSYGGYVYQVMGLLSVMEKSVTPIHTIATGAAMSCGFMMLIFGHKKFAYELATPMYHSIASDFWGKIQDLEESMKETKRLQNKFEELVIRKTRITKEKLDEVRSRKIDWYMSAQEAKEYGVIDEVI